MQWQAQENLVTLHDDQQFFLMCKNQIEQNWKKMKKYAYWAYKYTKGGGGK